MSRCCRVVATVAELGRLALHSTTLLTCRPFVQVSPRLSPTKKKKLLPEPTPTRAQQRLAERERRRQALVGSQPDPYQLIAEQARGCATLCIWGAVACIAAVQHKLPQ